MKKKEAEVSIYDQIKELKKNQSWNEIVDLVDRDIDKHKVEREMNGTICYQFFDILDYLYNCNCHFNGAEELPNWAGNGEIILMNEKANALKKLRNYPEAISIIDSMIEVAPNTARFYLMKSEIALAQEDVIEAENLLKEAYKYIWRSNDFAVMLSQFACISMIKENYDDALAYASLALTHNKNDSVKVFANNILNKVKVLKGKEDLTILDKYDAIDSFSAHELLFPVDTNEHFAYDAYEYVLRNKEDMGEGQVKYTRDNLIMLLKGHKIAAKVIEVSVLTGNYLYARNDYMFTFQASKEYRQKDTTGAPPGRFYELSDGKNIVYIEGVENIDSDDEYYSVVENVIGEHVNEGFVLIEREKLHIKDELLAEKVIFDLGNGSYCTMYWLKFSNKLAGRVYTVDTTPQSEGEREIINIVSTWEYMH